MKKRIFLGILLFIVLTAFAFNKHVPVEEGTIGSNYIVFFQATEYNSKLADAIEYLFEDMVKPEDRLTIFSPVKPYGFSQKTRSSQSKKKLIKATKNVLKRDIVGGTVNYQQILDSMADIVIEIGNAMGISASGTNSGFSSGNSGTIKSYLINYRQLLEEMRSLRKLDENLFLKLAGMLKKLNGKSYIFVIYQKESRIIPSRNVMNALMENADVQFEAAEVFQQDDIKEFINVETVSNALKESDVTLNFFYLKKNERRRRGMEIKEFSGDVYSVFSKLAKNTGGMVITTSKLKNAFRETMEK